jgi:hypothetical protein
MTEQNSYKIVEATRLAVLLEKYINDKLSVEEAQELDRLISLNKFNTALFNEVKDIPSRERLLEKLCYFDNNTEKAWQQVLFKISRIKQSSESKVLTFRGWMSAAAVFITLIIGAWLLIRKADKHKEVVRVISNKSTNDILPGSQKAILILGDGKNISLNATADSSFKEEGSQVKNTSKGWLVYKNLASASEITYNTIRTPNGGEYAVVLDDGTKVWLNAASSLYYPVRFTGKERRVTLTGEAYFKVAKNPARPFIVDVNGMNVQALGTGFNINADADESVIQTTLLEGSVKVSTPASAGNTSLLLSPGQQARLTKKNQLTLGKDIDTEEITAWKDGYFHFESADLKTILRQFARWYDVEIIYEGEIKNRKFFGIVKRNTTLLNVIKMLQANDIKFRIEGKKLIVQSG